MNEAIVTAICVGLDEDVGKTRVPEVVVHQFGLAGDRHAGVMRRKKTGPLKGQTIFNERQWSAVSEEEARLLEERLGIDLPAGALGENFRFSGILEFSKLPRGTILRFASGVALVVAEENEPCRQCADYLAALSGLSKVSREFAKAAYGLRGLVGWVELAGTVREGDSMRLEAADKQYAERPI